MSYADQSEDGPRMLREMEVLREENAALKLENAEHLQLCGEDAKTIDRLQKNLQEVLANERALLPCIDEAPVVFGHSTPETGGISFDWHIGLDTKAFKAGEINASARLVRIEEIPKEKNRMTFKTLALEITKREKGRRQVNIADASEVLARLVDIIMDEPNETLQLLAKEADVIPVVKDAAIAFENQYYVAGPNAPKLLGPDADHDDVKCLIRHAKEPGACK